MNKLTEEIISYMTNGWSTSEKKTEWDTFKEDEIKDEYPEIYAKIKHVKTLAKFM